jgi:hypothetical protein
MPTDVTLLQVAHCACLLVVLSLLLARHRFNYFAISFCCIVRYLSLHDVDVPVITQKRGRIYLSWTDASICESGFVFDRKGSSFTPDYSFQSPTRCFTTHSPSSIYDDLTATPSIKLGSTQTYCVRAANEVGYAEGYRSAPACQDIVIAWEAGVSVEHVCSFDILVCLSFIILLCDRAPVSNTLLSLFQVSGVVRGSDIAGKLPTKEATISWFLVNNPHVNGITSTDEDGKYDFLVQVCHVM